MLKGYYFCLNMKEGFCYAQKSPLLNVLNQLFRTFKIIISDLIEI
jgi:hypothetical protein